MLHLHAPPLRRGKQLAPHCSPLHDADEASGNALAPMLLGYAKVSQESLPKESPWLDAHVADHLRINVRDVAVSQFDLALAVARELVELQDLPQVVQLGRAKPAERPVIEVTCLPLLHCRATPTECLTFLGKPVSSMIQ